MYLEGKFLLTYIFEIFLFISKSIFSSKLTFNGTECLHIQIYGFDLNYIIVNINSCPLLRMIENISFCINKREQPLTHIDGY